MSDFNFDIPKSPINIDGREAVLVAFNRRTGEWLAIAMEGSITHVYTTTDSGFYQRLAARTDDVNHIVVNPNAANSYADTGKAQIVASGLFTSMGARYTQEHIWLNNDALCGAVGETTVGQAINGELLNLKMAA